MSPGLYLVVALNVRRIRWRTGIIIPFSLKIAPAVQCYAKLNLKSSTVFTLRNFDNIETIFRSKVALSLR